MESLQDLGGAGWRDRDRVSSRRKKWLLSLIGGDVAQTEAERGLVGRCQHLRAVSWLVWPGRAWGPQPRVQPKQKAPIEKGSPVKCCTNISEA